MKARDKLNAEEVRLLDMEKEKQGDALAEEWENQILGSGKAKIEWIGKTWSSQKVLAGTDFERLLLKELLCL